jgi:hypothetical protein
VPEAKRGFESQPSHETGPGPGPTTLPADLSPHRVRAVTRTSIAGGAPSRSAQLRSSRLRADRDCAQPCHRTIQWRVHPSTFCTATLPPHPAGLVTLTSIQCPPAVSQTVIHRDLISNHSNKLSYQSLSDTLASVTTGEALLSITFVLSAIHCSSDIGRSLMM